MKHLPVWNSPLTPLIFQNNPYTRKPTVAAIDALVLQRGDDFLEDLTPAYFKPRFVDELSSTAKETIELLGGKVLEPGEYAYLYVAPSLPQQATTVQLPLIRRLLEQLIAFKPHFLQQHSYSSRHVLQTRGLIPDRTGRLRVGCELFNPTNSIFTSSFGEDDTAFPHAAVADVSLEEFGVQSNVNFNNF